MSDVAVGLCLFAQLRSVGYAYAQLHMTQTSRGLVQSNTLNLCISHQCLHSGSAKIEPSSPALPHRPSKTATGNSTPGPKAPAALFVAQSPDEDRNKAKEVWMAHLVRNAGHTVEQAEAGESVEATGLRCLWLSQVP